MPLGEEDLKFKLTTDVDTTKVKSGLSDVGKLMADIDNDLADMSNKILLPTEKMTTALDHNLFLMKTISTELERQQVAARAVDFDVSESLLPTEKLLNSIGNALDANNERLALTNQKWATQLSLVDSIRADFGAISSESLLPSEKMLTSIDSALHKPELPEALPAPPNGILQLLSGMASGHGLNLRQLAGSALGGAIGGGGAGALGSAAGGAGVEALSAAFGPMGVAAGAAAGGILLMIDKVKDLTNTVAGFVQVASPSAFYRWQYTLKDLEGVIGQRLVPVLDLATEGTRAFADALAQVLPSASKMQELTSGIKGFFETITSGLGLATPQVRDFYRGLVNGLSLGFFGGGGSSFGAAAHPAQFSGVEEYEKGFQQQALSASSLQDIPKQTLSVLEQIRDILAGGPKIPEGGFVQGALSASDDPFGIRRAMFGF